jgi:hypothetical protein
MDDWQYLERQVVEDPQGRQWSVALMDVLGQAGDPDRPAAMLELEYASGRYFTLIYSGGGTLQWERSYPSLPEAMSAYERLLAAVINGRVDPAQPVFREDLED